MLKIYADNDLNFADLFAERLPYLAERPVTVELNDRAKVLMLQLDEDIAFLLLIALKLKPYLAGNADPHRRAMTSLLSGITSTLTGIRQLISIGLVLPAFQLCRPLRDKVNVALLCSVDADIALRFIGTTTQAVANHFWHELLAREKDVKAIDQALIQHAGSASILFPSIESNLNQMLGMFVHPSFVGSGLAMETDLLQMVLPDPGAISLAHRPLSFAIHQTFRILLGLFRPSVLSGQPVDELIPETDREFVGKLRRSLFELYLFTIVRLSRAPWINAANI